MVHYHDRKFIIGVVILDSDMHIKNILQYYFQYSLSGPLICRIQEVLESPNRSVAGRSDQNPKHGHTQKRMNQHSITHTSTSGLHTILF